MPKTTYAVDNSAILYLALMRERHTNIYRFTMTMKHEIDPGILQQAVDRIYRRFPTIIAGFRPGFFQYRVVPAEIPPQVLPDPGTLIPMSRREIAAEISDTKDLLPGRCPVRLLRPPGGCCSDGVDQVAGALGLAVAGWSVDPRDWATQNTAAVGKTILDQVKDGDIILMHDMSASSVSAALNAVDTLKRRGFTFVTVSELARLRHTRLIPGAHYRCFPR
jgi:hypothetical protein